MTYNYWQLLYFLPLGWLLGSCGQRLMNILLRRQAVLMLEEGIVNPHIQVPPSLMTIAVTLLLAAAYWRSVSVAEFVLTALIYWLLWLICLVDLKYQYIFDEAVLVLALPIMAYNLLTAAELSDGLYAAVVGGAVMLALAVVTRGALGGGDIKLTAVLGLWLGLWGLLNLICMAFISGSLLGLLLLALRLKKRRDNVAFGPYLALGAFIYHMGWYALKI